MKDRPLIAFLTAEAMAFTGTKMTMLALPWFVLTTTGSATRLGVVAFAQTGSYVLVKAAGAPLIDRVGRKTCTIGGGMAAAGILAAIPIAWHAGVLPFAVLVVLVALLGAVQSLGDAAKRLLIPDIVEATGRPLERVTGLYAGVERLSFLLGAPVAGVLIAAVGAANVLLLDAIASAAAATLIAAAIPIRTATSEEHPQHYLQSLRSGLRYVRRDPLLVSICGLLLATNFIDQATIVVFAPMWAKQVLDNPAALGLIVGVYGAGAVAGSLLFAWIGPRMSRYWTFSIALLLAGSPLLFTLALSDWLPLVLGVAASAGLIAAAINPIIHATMFERVPQPMQARVFGFTGSFAWAGIPFGALVAGTLTDAHGRTPALLLFAATYLAITTVPLAAHKRAQAALAAAGSSRADV